jgi:hypothetical protein
MGHTSGALRSRNFASSARGLRPDGKNASMVERCADEKTTERLRLSWVVVTVLVLETLQSTVTDWVVCLFRTLPH